MRPRTGKKHGERRLHQCGGKIQHRSRELARQHAWKLTKAGHAVTIYFCEWCKHLHVGHAISKKKCPGCLKVTA